MIMPAAMMTRISIITHSKIMQGTHTFRVTGLVCVHTTGRRLLNTSICRGIYDANANLADIEDAMGLVKALSFSTPTPAEKAEE